MIHQLDFNGKDKVDKAIMRLQAYEPKEGYYLCFSGGKDSVVIKALADMAGVKYDAHYNISSVDPPELVRFIKEKHPDVEFTLCMKVISITMDQYQKISENGILPTFISTDYKRGGGYCVVIRREDGADLCTQRMCEHSGSERLQTTTGGDI